MSDDNIYDGTQALLAPIVYHLTEAGRSMRAAVAAGMDLKAIGVELRSRMPPDSLVDELNASMEPAYALQATVRRLLAEAPTLPGQAPAIEAHVVLAGMSGPISGALSETPEGGLRLLTRGVVPGSVSHRATDTVEMIEHFFDYDRVTCIARMITVEVELPRIITS